jgi:ferritin-like metal-binding protein YciE
MQFLEWTSIRFPASRSPAPKVTIGIRACRAVGKRPGRRSITGTPVARLCQILMELAVQRGVFGYTNRQKEIEDMVKEKTLEDLFLNTLQDIYYAERKILKALPKMKRAAQSSDLKAAFDKHIDETEVQIERLQQVFESVGKRVRGKTCDAIEGILAEGEEIMDEFKDTMALDAGLISSAQAVEHYEITRYGTLKRWAEELGMADAAKLLNATLMEESRTDGDLTKLAETAVNAKAMSKTAA